MEIHPQTIKTRAGVIVGAALCAALIACNDDPPGPRFAASPGVQETPDLRTISPGPTETPVAECSAAGLSDAGSAAGLPEPVAQMRADIITAARACDYKELQRLLLGGRDLASFSYGAEVKAARYWRAIEEEFASGSDLGSPVMELLVRTLSLPHFVEVQSLDAEGEQEHDVYIWPTAHTRNPTDEDWAMVEPLYGQDVIDRMKKLGIGFVGYRIGIVADGDWIYFIAGD